MKIKFSFWIWCVFALCLHATTSCGNKEEKKKVFTRVYPTIRTKLLPLQVIKERSKKLDKHFAHVALHKGFNGVVFAAQGTQVIYKKAFGYQDSGKKNPLSTEAVFQIASVSKQFTAAAILLLKQQGKLSFADSIQNYFPDFPYRGITIRHLLTHHSGLANYTYFCDKLWDRKKPIDNQTVIQLMSEKIPSPYFPPGRTYDYSNTGYMILAGIVERVSGASFEEFMHKNIFLPSGMTSTVVYSHTRPASITNAVDGYNYGWRRVVHTYLDGVVGDKGVYSSVQDLYRWNRILYTDSLLKKAIIEEAFQPALAVKKNKDNYGFGWRIKDYHGDKVVWHSGWWQGYKSIFIRNLKDQTAIIVLTNSMAGHFKSEDLLDLYYSK